LIGQEHQVLIGVRIAIADASLRRGLVAGGIEVVERACADRRSSRCRDRALQRTRAAQVARFVQIRMRRVANRIAKDRVVEPVGLCREARASMARRLSRYVNCAKAIEPNCSVHVSIWARLSPR